MRIYKKILDNKLVLITILIAIVLNLSFLGYLFIKSDQPSDIQNKTTTLSEVQQIKITQDTLLRQKLYLRLIERVGPIQAQVDLVKSGLPFDGKTHLLNHIVGDWIYEKYGTEGLIHCKDFFLSSCYHGFVIKAIAENGLSVLDKVMTSCHKEGPTTTSQCAHAIGHGLLAWEGYENLPKALTRCDDLQYTSNDFPVYNCYDGVFMENVWAVHENGEPSPDRWIDNNDPVFPCNSPQIGSKYLKACWSNQPQLMYQLFKGDLKKIATECDKLTDTDIQWTCFDSIARQIHPATNGNVNMTFKLCGLMPGKWQTECLFSNVSASYSVGDRKIPFIICEKIANDQKEGCYNRLLNMIMTYSKSEKEKNIACTSIRNREWSQICRENKI